jgi:hypothetical protein
MQDQRDHRRTDAIEDRSDGLEVTEIDIEGAERGNDDEVRQNECPASRPRAPEAGAQVGDIDTNLNRQRPRQGLTDGDGLAHLLLGHPATLADEIALHLADQRHWAAEPEEPKAQEVGYDFGDAAGWNRLWLSHRSRPQHCLIMESRRYFLRQWFMQIA